MDDSIPPVSCPVLRLGPGARSWSSAYVPRCQGLGGDLSRNPVVQRRHVGHQIERDELRLARMAALLRISDRLEQRRMSDDPAELTLYLTARYPDAFRGQPDPDPGPRCGIRLDVVRRDGAIRVDIKRVLHHRPRGEGIVRTPTGAPNQYGQCADRNRGAPCEAGPAEPALGLLGIRPHAVSVRPSSALEHEGTGSGQSGAGPLKLGQEETGSMRRDG